MSARATPLACAIVACAVLVGCSDEVDRIDLPLVLETFEAGCGDLPCQWTPTPGSEGAVSRVRTVHDGVHGLRLEGDGVGARGPARVDGLSSSGGFSRGPEIVYVPPPWESPLGARVTGRCDTDGAALEILVVADVGLEDPAADPPVLVDYRGTVTPGPSFADPRSGLLLPEPGDPAPPEGAQVLDATEVALRKTGPGACEVALLVVGPPPS